MDTAFLRKTFALIAKGLVEKEQLLQKDPTRYPYSKMLQHGINMFLVASHQVGCVGNDIQKYADESMFLNHFITKPIAEWFCNWNPEVVDKLCLQEQPFFAYGSFAYRRNEHMYIPSSECYEFLETQDNDIMDGTDERVLYEKMILLDQKSYCQVRRYIIEHPIITLEERRMMSLELANNQLAKDAFQFAYEEFNEEGYRCPSCGWTMTKGKYDFNCHSSHCTDTLPELTDELKLNIKEESLFRLKKGVMRYFAYPGKLEMAIVEFCEKKKIAWTLWPQMDRYDVEIQFSDCEVWEIDAKAYRNPVALRCKIQNDNGFPSGEFARGYFVVPNEYTVNQRNYTSIVNSALTEQKNVKCITLKALKTEITRKEAACHEAE